jgi:hypothetical protein
MAGLDSTSSGGPVHLTDFRVVTGAFVPLDDLTDADVVANRDALREAGMTGAAVLGEHSVRAAARTLVARPLPGTTAGLVYATDDFADTAPSDVLAELLVSADLASTPGFVVSGNGCANLGPALRSAAALCLPGAPTVVVTADRALPGLRVLTDNMSLVGDAAAACVVTAEPEGPAFELVSACSAMRAVPAGPRRPTAALRATLDGVREATRGALDAAGWAAGDLVGMLVPEYSATARRLLAAASGIAGQLDLPRATAGHCHSTDLLRGLADLVTERLLGDGDRLLALASGPTSWAVFALRYTGGVRS